MLRTDFSWLLMSILAAEAARSLRQATATIGSTEIRTIAREPSSLELHSSSSA